MLANAFAKLSIEPPSGLFDAIATRSLEKITEFTNQNLCNLANAFAKLNIASRLDLFDAIAMVSQDRIHDFEPQHLSNLANAFAKLGILPPENLFQAIGRSFLEKKDKFDQQALSNLAYAFAKLSIIPPKGFFAAIAERSISLIDDFTMQALSNLAWASAIMNPKHKELFEVIARRIPVQTEGLNGKNLSQLFYASALILPRPQIYHHLKSSLVLDHAYSNLQKNVAKHLKQLHTNISEEYFDDVLCHNIDIALVNENIAIEVDGPFHFAINTQHPLGDVVLRNKLLERNGWNPRLIPYWEWNALNSDEDKRNYLVNLLHPIQLTVMA